MRLCRLLAAASALGLAGGAERDPMEALRLATEKVAASADRIPNYTCVETVNRSHFRPAASTLSRACPVVMDLRSHPTPDMALRLLMKDRLRLDVAMLKTGEIFSWVGASRFDDVGIEHLVQGPMGTGAFGGFLALVFRQDTKKVAFEKSITVGGRGLLEYSFQVARADSHYKVRAGESWVFSGYGGTFQVDPETNDVVRLEVQTIELPPAANICMTTTGMDFEMVHIGDSRFLLTTSASQRFVFPDGEETENTTRFADCHEYRGESTITFEEPGQHAAGAASPAAAIPDRVPAGLRFTMELTEPIDPETAAAGDRFSARLTAPLRDDKRKLLARAGAAVEGRLMRVQSYGDPQTEVVVALQPETLEFQGVKTPLSALRDFTQEITAAAGRGRRGMPFVLPAQTEQRAGLFHFAGARVLLKKGFRSDWKTVDRR